MAAAAGPSAQNPAVDRLVYDRARTDTLILGIDFGTSAVRAAYWDPNYGHPFVVRDVHRKGSVPAAVAYIGEDRFVGDAALAHEALYPQGVIREIKRIVGRRMADPVIQANLKRWNFRVTSTTGINPIISAIADRRTANLVPAEVAAVLLNEVRVNAEEQSGSRIKNAVITIPVSFSALQRQALRDAAALAGLKTVRLVEEPVAAAATYTFDWASFEGMGSGWSELGPPSGVNTEGKVSMTFMVFDMGVAHTNVSIQTYEDQNLQVHAMVGDQQLGGEDFTQKIVGYVRQEFKKAERVDVGASPLAMWRLRAACEAAKLALTTQEKAPVDVTSIYNGYDLSAVVTRAAFVEVTQELFRRALALISRCMQEAKVTKEQIHDVVLVGGGTRMPLLEELIKEFFDGRQVRRTLGPDESTALGACLLCAVLTNYAETDAYRKEPPRRSIVAPPKWMFNEVTHTKYTVALASEELVVVVPANSRMPTRRSVQLSTCSENQASVLVEIYEGEGEGAGDPAVTLLGKVELGGLYQTPRGVALLDITLEVLLHRVLRVTVTDRHTKNKKELIINPNEYRVSKEDIARFLEEGARYRARQIAFLQGDGPSDPVGAQLHALKRAALHVPVESSSDLAAEASLALARCRSFVATQVAAENGLVVEPSRTWRTVCQVCTHVETLYLDRVGTAAAEAKLKAHLLVKLDELRSLVPLAHRAALVYWDERADVNPDAASNDPRAAMSLRTARLVPADRSRTGLGRPLSFESDEAFEAFCQMLLELNGEAEERLARVGQAQLYYHKNGTYFSVHYFERGVERLNAVLLIMQMLAVHLPENRKFLQRDRPRAAYVGLLEKIRAQYFESANLQWAASSEGAAAGSGAAPNPLLVQKREQVYATIEKAKRLFDPPSGASPPPKTAAAVAEALAQGQALAEGLNVPTQAALPEGEAAQEAPEAAPAPADGAA